MNPADYYQDYKEKKVGLASSILGSYYHNAPNPITSIHYTGTASLVWETPRAAPFVSAVRYEYNWDLSLLNSYTRKAVEFRTIDDDAPLQAEYIAPDEFYMVHRAGAPWAFYGATPPTGTSAAIQIGTCRRVDWVIVAGAWTVISDTTHAIGARGSFIISGGGDAASGGRNLEDDTEKTTISGDLDFSKLSGTLYTIPTFNPHHAKRFPWDSSWTAEANAWKAGFDSWVATNFAPVYLVSQSYSCGFSFS